MFTENAQVLVDDIEVLLKDICAFLSKTVSDGFSEEQKLIAKKLIDRSKSQLQTITQLTSAISEPDTSYVDMTPKANRDPKEHHAEYCAMDEQPIKDCPYTTKSASELKLGNHWGYLERKKSHWFIGRQIRQFAIVIDGWLLLYNSDTDTKPVEYLDLETYTLKYCDPKATKCKKEAKSLELVSDTKNYHFIAKNNKDVDQWATAISKTSKMVSFQTIAEIPTENNQIIKQKVFKTLPPLPMRESVPNQYVTNNPPINMEEEPMDTYDAVIVQKNGEDEDEENFYECPMNVNTPPIQPNKTPDKPPPLPPPLSKPKSFLHSPKHKSYQAHPVSPKEGDEEEEVEYDLPLNEKYKEVLNNGATVLSSTARKVEVIDDEPDVEYDEVVSSPSAGNVEEKISVKELIGKANKVETLPKPQLKPKFAGIGRGINFTTRR